MEFNPGEKVMVKAHTVGCYPLALCTIIKKMVDEARPCPTCGQMWPGHSPTFCHDNPGYLVEHDKTGARAIYDAEKIKRA
jgi:hypothetical protein